MVCQSDDIVTSMSFLKGGMCIVRMLNRYICFVIHFLCLCRILISSNKWCVITSRFDHQLVLVHYHFSDHHLWWRIFCDKIYDLCYWEGNKVFVVTRSLCWKLESRYFRRASSFRRLDLSISNVSFCCGVEFPSVTTSVSQLFGREPTIIMTIPHLLQVCIKRQFDWLTLEIHSGALPY